MERQTVEDVLALIEERPGDADLFQLHGRLYLKQGRLEDAGVAYERSLSLDPSDPFTHLYLGNWFWRCEKHKEALEKFKHAAELLPNDAVAYLCQGDLYGAQGKYDLAEEAYIMAARVDPSDPQAQRKLLEWYDFVYGLRWRGQRSDQNA